MRSSLVKRHVLLPLLSMVCVAGLFILHRSNQDRPLCTVPADATPPSAPSWDSRAVEENAHRRQRELDHTAAALERFTRLLIESMSTTQLAPKLTPRPTEPPTSTRLPTR